MLIGSPPTLRGTAASVSLRSLLVSESRSGYHVAPWGQSVEYHQARERVGLV